MLDSLMAAGVPFRFSEDMRSISMDHDGTPPEGGPLDCRDTPDMVPILSVLASRARGKSALGHVAHVRLKESDRVASMLQLRKMGAKVEFDGNDMTFEGVQRLRGANLSSFNDHRVLMALTVAGSIATGVTELSYPHAYRISYPEFLDHMKALGVPAAVSGRVPRSRVQPMILDDLQRHASERPDGRAVVEVRADGAGASSRGASWRARPTGSRVALECLGGAARRHRRLPAAEPARVRDDRAGDALPRRDLRAADADLPRARGVVHAAQSGARTLFVPGVFRGRDYAAMAHALRGELPALEHVVVVDGPEPRAIRTAGRPAPRPDRSRSCCSPRARPASPRARSTATTTLMRAADHRDRPLRPQRRRRRVRPVAARPPDRLPVRDVDRDPARRAAGAPGGVGRRGRRSTRCSGSA